MRQERDRIRIPFGTNPGVLIGKKGMVVKTIQRDSGVSRIEVEENHVIISGHANARQRARRMIQAVIDSNRVCFIDLPDIYPEGAFYGRYSCNRDYISNTCDVNLKLNRATRNVRIEGTVEAISKARSMLQFQFDTYCTRPTSFLPMYSAFLLDSNSSTFPSKS